MAQLQFGRRWRAPRHSVSFAFDFMTPDGIPTTEWDRVHELAVEIANASVRDDDTVSESGTEELLCYLGELRTRYGDLPSILGTLGDYTEHELDRYDLYARGATEAQRLGDRKNLQIIVESILELGCLDRDQRSFWESKLNASKIEPPGRSELRDEN